ncbi:ACP S-malonyltransferase [Xylophilus ampelinus]|uniref:Malonyl CoA-acyl carrier protein transacylase n=1 Tax=Xylophilus ampelinus TaxID=54067 RepID=A0A318SJX7_9BURK|nr:ACP S-malonyltransferase [Xylophilus ampelinus]MCS4509468.1 ACP S-malonyltransferase [Xylophilus ampelinus]PYE79197.1 [acyl-carrier-protein] S-malonyltransferase [Xylophilus ampelinus]
MGAFAFVFPGQGSQSVGMLDAWDGHPAVAEAVQEASDALHEDVGRLIEEGPRETLALTTNTQPVMLVAAVAAWRAWKAEGGADPIAVAGHSLGEYSALVAAGVLTLTQAAPLVRFRAAAMQEAVPVGVGAMAAILGLDAQKVIAGCQEVTQSFGTSSSEVVEAVNFNDPGQTVVAGSKAAVEKACEALKAAGAKRALPLPVSAPFHSTLMRPAAERLRQKLADTAFATPRIALVDNIDVAVQDDPAAIRDALYRQAFGPVRWVECIRSLKARGALTVVECGPGKVLAGMTKRIDPALAALAVHDPATLAEAKALLA